MKFEQPNCPECGEELRGIIEQIQGCAELALQADNESYAYAGNTDVWWDEQRPLRDPEGRINLVCHNGHDWWSKVTDSEDGDPPDSATWVDEDNKRLKAELFGEPCEECERSYGPKYHGPCEHQRKDLP